MLAIAWSTGIHVRWLGKHTLFAGPAGPLMRALGGIPVDRRDPSRVVNDVVGRLRAGEVFSLVVTPEGTRGAGSYWKSGFYRIAREAHLPVTLGYVDRTTMTTGLGPTIDLTGDVRADMDVARVLRRQVGPPARAAHRAAPARGGRARLTGSPTPALSDARPASGHRQVRCPGALRSPHTLHPPDGCPGHLAGGFWTPVEPHEDALRRTWRTGHPYSGAALRRRWSLVLHLHTVPSSRSTVRAPHDVGPPRHRKRVPDEATPRGAPRRRRGRDRDHRPDRDRPQRLGARLDHLSPAGRTTARRAPRPSTAVPSSTSRSPSRPPRAR